MKLHLFVGSLLTGVLLSLLLSATITLMHWFENPGGVFHGPSGTYWGSVFETFWSWFLPTLPLAVAVAVVILLLFYVVRKSRGQD